MWNHSTKTITVEKVKPIASVSKNQITKQNNETIDNFFFMYGSETRHELSSFLFNMMANFTETMADGGGEYNEECVLHFQMLHQLVCGLQPVTKLNR